MGVSSRKPFGILALSFSALLSSGLLILLAIRTSSLAIHFVRFRTDRLEDRVEPLAYAVVPLACAALFALAYISLVAAIDLWRLRVRGRKLAATAMFFVFLLGCDFIWSSITMSETDGNALRGATICFLAICAALYLCLPAVKSKFQ
jgi:hypothetical protein